MKGDKLVVSIGTNFAFISGKSKLLDHSSYGYEFEETDYNPTYTNYKKYQQFMGSQSNDNDEFMWSANFVDTVDLKTLTGDSHNYKTVSVPATCGRNAFTEERCSDCGLIKDGTRVEEEGTAHEHHYIKFHETYYTKMIMAIGMKQTTMFAQSAVLVLQNLLSPNMNRLILHTRKEKLSGMKLRRTQQKDMLTQQQMLSGEMITQALHSRI